MHSSAARRAAHRPGDTRAHRGEIVAHVFRSPFVHSVAPCAAVPSVSSVSPVVSVLIEVEMYRCIVACVVWVLVAGVPHGQVQAPRYPGLPSETPKTFTPIAEGFDYVRRDVMIPMRDGVKLHTVIIVPRSALGARTAPILLTRTPYNATDLTTHADSAHLTSILEGYDNATDVIVEGGYIRVVQDVRGKYGSEGDYVMNRPLRGPLNPTPVDHATDTYDTIDWL